MARLPRHVIAQHPHLVIQYGNNLQPVFLDDDDYLVFCNWLREASRQFKVTLHAYALLPDRFYLLATPSESQALGRMMQWVGRYYVPYFNRKYQRSGTLWQSRFKASVIEAEPYLMTCCRYIEQSPARAGLAAAQDYPWSSYAHHAGMRNDAMVSDHGLYWALGNTPFDREMAYRAALEKPLSRNDISAIEECVLKGWALGTEQFKAALEKAGARRLSPAKRGRPPKEAGSSRASG